MAWNTPSDWAYKEAPGSSKMNSQVRDNLSYLKASLPAGVIMDYAGATAPAQWLLCDGSAVSRTTYADLYAAIGVTFGVGDNSTTFNLPDKRGRVSVGAGTGTSLTARILAAIFGAETHTLTGAESGEKGHNHTQDVHAHLLPTHTTGSRNGFSIDAASNGNSSTSFDTTATNQAVGASSAANAHNNLQPSIVLTAIIKY